MCADDFAQCCSLFSRDCSAGEELLGFPSVAVALMLARNSHHFQGRSRKNVDFCSIPKISVMSRRVV